MLGRDRGTNHLLVIGGHDTIDARCRHLCYSRQRKRQQRNNQHKQSFLHKISNVLIKN